MERTLKFKKDYAIAVDNLSDKDAGKFIKMLCKYYFQDKEEKISNPLLAVYFSLIRGKLDDEKARDDEDIIRNNLSLEKRGNMLLDSMFATIQNLEDLIDYEVSKLFIKEGDLNGKDNKQQIKDDKSEIPR